MEDLEVLLKFIDYLEMKFRGDPIFQLQCVKKFIKGRKEHEEDILQIDCPREILQERMDITAYEFIQELQDKHR